MTFNEVLILAGCSALGSLAGALAGARVIVWRLKSIEDRLLPLDRGPRNVLTRLTALEARRAH